MAFQITHEYQLYSALTNNFQMPANTIFATDDRTMLSEKFEGYLVDVLHNLGPSSQAYKLLDVMINYFEVIREDINQFIH